MGIMSASTLNNVRQVAPVPFATRPMPQARPVMGVIMDEDGTAADLTSLTPKRCSYSTHSSNSNRRRTGLYVGMTVSIIASVCLFAAATIIFLDGFNG